MLVGLQAFFTVLLNLLFGLALIYIAYIRFKKITNLTTQHSSKSNSIWTSVILLYSVITGTWNCYNSQVNIPILNVLFLLFLAITSSLSLTTFIYINFYLIKFIRESNNIYFIHKLSKCRQERGPTKVVIIMSVVQTICFCPTGVAWAVAGLSYLLNYTLQTSFNTLVHLLHFLILLDSGLNALIFLSYSKSIKQYLKRFCQPKDRKKSDVFTLEMYRMFDENKVD